MMVTADLKDVQELVDCENGEQVTVRLTLALTSNPVVLTIAGEDGFEEALLDPGQARTLAIQLLQAADLADQAGLTG
jgi:hypothetical protein